MIDVSIIIPTYKRPELTAQAVNSCKKQSGCSIEIIVVHDGDNIDQKLDGNVRQIYQEHKGAAAARNLGLSEAKGTYIKFLDSDDLLNPESLCKQVVELEKSNADVSVGKWKYCDSEGNPENHIHCEYIEDMLPILVAGFWNANFSYLFRKSWLISNHCKWDIDCAVLQDFAFIMEVSLKRARFIKSDIETGFYRRHKLGQRVSRSSDECRSKHYYEILESAQKYLLTSNKINPVYTTLIDTQMKKISAMESIPENISAMTRACRLT
ncbi:MAG: glycosyltransferase [Kiritimatiellales bacterium]|nr:glycosyltransferase [Kiritimatiellales bacterium]